MLEPTYASMDSEVGKTVSRRAQPLGWKKKSKKKRFHFFLCINCVAIVMMMLMRMEHAPQMWKLVPFFSVSSYITSTHFVVSSAPLRWMAASHLINNTHARTCACVGWVCKKWVV